MPNMTHLKMKAAMPVSLKERLAIPLGCQKTTPKWLVLSPTRWGKQLAIRLGCKRPQPSRWLSRKRARGQTNRCANLYLTMALPFPGNTRCTCPVTSSTICALLHLVEQRDEDARARGADRMPQGDRPAIDVEFVRIETEILA